MMKQYNKAIRDINDIPVFKIDWEAAIKDIEKYLNREDVQSDFDKNVKGYGMLCKVKRFYQSDNIQGYLEFLDENRKTLKAE